jgi:subtilase family serine protease
VKYTYREYLSNTNSCYYHYAVIAVYTNGQKQQIGTVTVKEGKCA